MARKSSLAAEQSHEGGGMSAQLKVEADVERAVILLVHFQRDRVEAKQDRTGYFVTSP